MKVSTIAENNPTMETNSKHHCPSPSTSNWRRIWITSVNHYKNATGTPGSSLIQYSATTGNSPIRKL
jgi:hypothetical protein